MARDEVSAAPAYAIAQLARALERARSGLTERERARAAERSGRWRQAIAGMLSGQVEVGSRTPVSGAPAWATPEVLHGGFASGALLAEGPLQDHEISLASRLGLAAEPRHRYTFNLHYLSDAGREQLARWLNDGCYRVQIPEEGALLVLAWLLQREHVVEAERLLEELGPQLARLRLYPAPADSPFVPSAVVHVQPVRDTIADLQNAASQQRLLAMRESIQIWLPLYDRLVALFLETVEGEPPRLTAGPADANAANKTRRLAVGGWPCRRFSSDWSERGRTLLAEYAELRQQHRLCAKPERKKENFARLRGYLSGYLQKGAFSAGEVSCVRHILAGYVSAHGTPGSEPLARVRGEQARNAGLPDHSAVRRLLIGRLASYPGDAGLSNLESAAAPVSASESKRLDLPEGAVVPAVLRAKLVRSLDAEIDELVRLGAVTSGEALARVLPQLSAQVRAASIADPALQRLYAAIYAAFRKRRSLLLLNLERQVRLEELPWIQAIEKHLEIDPGKQNVARQVLEQLCVLAFSAFPHQLPPNKLLTELRALGSAAGLKLALVEELAADIFMGTFTPKFQTAAEVAAKLLQGSIYERYYGLPFDRFLDARTPSRAEVPRSPDDFAMLCAQLAKQPRTHGSPAVNGTILEQQQLLTTQNLAVLFEAAHLTDLLRGRLMPMAQHCYRWILRRVQVKVAKPHARLIHIKNAAYAWRNMLFYLSFVPDAEQQSFGGWARELLATQRDLGFRRRFEPALLGLELVLAGADLDALSAFGKPKRFLGWSVQRHWLLHDDVRLAR